MYYKNIVSNSIPMKDSNNVKHSNVLNVQNEQAQFIYYANKLLMQVQHELYTIRKLRQEMEQYKISFSIQVKDDATKKIQEVLSSLDKLGKP